MLTMEEDIMAHIEVTMVTLIIPGIIGMAILGTIEVSDMVGNTTIPTSLTEGITTATLAKGIIKDTLDHIY